MEYRRLGGSGLQVSAVGLGCNNFGRRMDAKQTEVVLRQCVESGINFIDTASTYGDGLSEEYIGKALKGIQGQLLVATKVGMEKADGPNRTGASRKHIMEQMEISLKRLGRDYVDLYQIHRPDPNTPIEETLRALDDLVRQGKVRYIGCSNYSAWQVAEAHWTSKSLNLHSFASVQPEYSLLYREPEKELVPFCKKYAIGILPFFPLAKGFLTGKYRPDQDLPAGARLSQNEASRQQLLTPVNFTLLAELERFAQERGHTVGELAIAWLLAKPSVSSVIAGATRTEQVIANAKAHEWRLTANDLEEIEKILKEHPSNYVHQVN